MGCVRKRGKSWNAQVRISGWRSFTKTFKTKLDATEWVFNFEKELLKRVTGFLSILFTYLV